MAGTVKTVTSNDGTVLGYRSVGKGPALIVIPGALSEAEDLSGLAAALAPAFTVHTLERRGRGVSGEQGPDYGMAKECEDVRALQAQTGARYLFGHSFGGLVALEVARNNAALTQVAVYEPGVSIDGSVRVDWVPCCRSELERGAAFEAFVTFARGVNPESSGKLPRWLFKLILRRVMGDEEIRRKEWLLPEAIREHLEVASLDNQYERYRDIAGEVTVLVGGRGPGAAKAGRTAQRLCTVLPRAQRVRLPKLDHFGPEQQPATVARALLEAFAAAGHASPTESVAV